MSFRVKEDTPANFALRERLLSVHGITNKGAPYLLRQYGSLYPDGPQLLLFFSKFYVINNNIVEAEKLNMIKDSTSIYPAINLDYLPSQAASLIPVSLIKQIFESQDPSLILNRAFSDKEIVRIIPDVGSRNFLRKLNDYLDDPSAVGSKGEACKRMLKAYFYGEKEVDLSHLKLNLISDAIGQLKETVVLKLNDNELTLIPTEIGNLENLAHLDVENNKLCHIPVRIKFNIKSSQIKMSGNMRKDLSSSQAWIVEPAKQLGLSFNYDEVCQGWAFMSLQAVLADDITGFCVRIKEIFQINLDEDKFNKFIDDINPQTNQKRNDMLAFFNGLVAYQAYQEQRWLGRIRHLVVTNPLLHPVSLDGQRGIQNIANVSAVFSEQTLTSFLVKLKKIVTDLHKVPLLLMSSFHILLVNYCPREKKWFLSDVNFPDQLFFSDEAKLVRHLIHCSWNFRKLDNSDRLIPVGIAAYTKGNACGSWIPDIKILCNSFIQINEEAIQAVSNFGMNWITIACLFNQLEIVKDLLNFKPSMIDYTTSDANQKNNDKATFLNQAAGEGHLEIVKELLKRGANPNLSDGFGMTPLSRAVKNGFEDIVYALLEHNPDFCKNCSGQSPIFIAACDGHAKILKGLLQHNPSYDLNSANNKGTTPLFTAVVNNHVEVVRVLLGHPLDINTRFTRGFTAVCAAAANNHLEILKELLDHGGDINLATDFGATPLFCASANGCLEVVKELLKRKADINLAAKDGLTPLLVAEANNRREVVEELLKH